MDMDKSWMNLNRSSIEYRKGVEEFLDFAFSKVSSNGKLLCPCRKCVNKYWKSRSTVREHLICEGFLPDYSCWFCHGESISASPLPNEVTNIHQNEENHYIHDMHGLVHDLFTMHNEVNVDDILEEETPPQVDDEEAINVNDFIEEETTPQLDNDTQSFYNFVKDANQELYPGSKKYSKLGFIVHLFHIKCLGGWSDKTWTMLLECLTDAFPLGDSFPKSTYQTKAYLRKLGLGYEKIHACPNDCMLFWKETKDESAYQSCLQCGESRWKKGETDEETISHKKKKIPAKVMRYFPLKPRLQRLYMSTKTASSMRWHAEGRTKDGLLRHPADSQAWKNFDKRYPDFALETRNVRLGLASDGFNPFGNMSSTHSIWPILLIPYNPSPVVCMDQSSLILSTLIPGPKGPGMKIDVYLQPLISELKEFWETGFATFDVSKCETFQLHASLLWTINDFPAYGYLSGWGTSGMYACPHCNYETCSKYLKYSRKCCYLGARRFLELDHPFRFDNRSFDGECEFRNPPSPPSGTTILGWLEENGMGSQPNIDGYVQPLKKKSIFFDLPYWEFNEIRHNIDVMHCEKNCFDNLHGTVMDVDGKSKDHLNARLDLHEMNIRSELHPQRNDSGKVYLPPACFSMTKEEKKLFCKTLKNIKVPDGFGSNISKCVNLDQMKLTGLKSHDCHNLMQQLLGIALRGALPTKVTSIIIRLSGIFKAVCAKVLDTKELDRLSSEAAIIICEMEKIFPPSFFTIMVHLVIHLPGEAKIAGPVQYRWMYGVERYLKKLKGYVRNKANPEGCIAEGYLAEECMTFCSRYLSGMETRFNRPRRNDDFNGSSSQVGGLIYNNGSPIGAVNTLKLDKKTWIQAHRYVLFNSDIVTPFLQEHISSIKRKNRGRRLTPMQIENIQNEQFHQWFQDHVAQLEQLGDARITDEIKWLARGPIYVARQFTGLNINGFKFHTKARGQKLKTQNFGVVNVSNTSSYATPKDKQPKTGEVTYYGYLDDIIELNYYDNFRVTLFKCGWVDVEKNRGRKVDQYGYTLVNFSKLIHTGENLRDDPFVLASQVNQVFYVQDQRDKEWYVAVEIKPRDLFDMGEVDGEDVEVFHETFTCTHGAGETTSENEHDLEDLVRHDTVGITLENVDELLNEMDIGPDMETC